MSRRHDKLVIRERLGLTLATLCGAALAIVGAKFFSPPITIGLFETGVMLALLICLAASVHLCIEWSVEHAEWHEDHGPRHY